MPCRRCRTLAHNCCMPGVQSSMGGKTNDAISLHDWWGMQYAGRRVRALVVPNSNARHASECLTPRNPSGRAVREADPVPSTIPLSLSVPPAWQVTVKRPLNCQFASPRMGRVPLVRRGSRRGLILITVCREKCRLNPNGARASLRIIRIGKSRLPAQSRAQTRWIAELTGVGGELRASSFMPPI